MARILVAIQLLWLPHAAQAATYATGGVGKYKNEILWLTWGDAANPNGRAGVALTGTAATSVANIQVAGGTNLQVTCSLQNSSGALQSYFPGAYSGDRLGRLYNSPGGLVSGIINTVNGATVNFEVVCTARLGTQDVDIQGFVIADAESMSLTEYIQSQAQGDWYVIDTFSAQPPNGQYRVVKSAQANGFNRINVSSTAANPGNTAVNFLKFTDPAPSKTMQFTIKGEGKTAIAIGLVVPYADFGDAPATYGDALHLIDEIQLDEDGIGRAGVAAVNTTAFKLSQFLSPSRHYVGTRGPDTEPSSQPSPNADKDDLTGLYPDEENGWPTQFKTLRGLLPGGNLSIPVACNGGGFVAGWIDFNLNGVFDAGERSQLARCTGSATLLWSVPADVKATATGSNTYARLRYATRSAEIQNAVGVAQDGEAEDHAITIAQPKLSISKTSNAGTAGWLVGQAGAQYVLTVSNVGNSPTGTGSATGAVKPLKVLDAMPAGVQPDWTGTLASNGWACTFSGQLVSCETSNHLQAQGAADSQSQIALPVKVTAAAAAGRDLVNYASVGGGLDPNNGGEPPNPQGCTTPGYCASTIITIGSPAVEVVKTASPAAQTQVKVGDVIQYTVVVTVRDSVTLSPVVLRDTLGLGLTYAGLASNPAGFIEGGSGVARTFTLPAGQQPGQYAVTYRATVATSAQTSVDNVVVPTGGGNPNNPNSPNPSCAAGCATTHPLASPLVTVSKSSDPAVGAVVKEGQIITYTLRAQVERSQTLSPMVLSDTLGAGLKFGAVVANQGYVTGTSGSGHTFTLPAGTAPGTYEIKYTAQVNTATSGSQSLTNVVQPSGGGKPGETPACTTCQTNHTLSKPKVEYSKATTAVSAKIGDDILYQLQVTVSDAPTTAAVTLTDTFQPGLQFSRMQDAGVFATTASAPASLVLTLPAGTAPGTYKASYFAKVVVTTPSVQNAVNRVQATGGDAPVCAAAGCATTTPLVLSSVSYSKKLSNAPKEVVVGQQLGFVMTVNVEDTATARVMTFKDNLGTGLTQGDTAPVLPGVGWSAQWTSASELTVTTPVNLPVGTYEIAYSAKVTKDATGTVKNTVRPVPVAGVDSPRCAANCATETPVAAPKVSFHKTSSVTSAKVGDNIPYVLAIKVADSSLTTDAELLVDNLGLGLNFNGDVIATTPNITHSIQGKSMVLKLLKGLEPGTYEVRYSAKVMADAVQSVHNQVEALPTNSGLVPVCDAACTVVTPVTRVIDAVNDALPDVKSTTGASFAGNAYSNDTLNGVPVELGKITGTVLTPATPINGGTVPMLDVTTGVVSVAPGTPAGNYSIVYQICDKLAPTVCDTATITIKVTASPIDAKDDTYTGNRGAGGDQVVGNAYAENDTLDGVALTPENITGTVTTPAQPIGGSSVVPLLDVVSGKVTVPAGTPAGEYSISYRICEKLNPSNCDDAVIKVTVKPDESLLRIVKTAAVRTVKIGDLVRYSLQVQNIGAVPVVGANVVDTAANGFTMVNGSMSAVGLGDAVAASGVRPVQFSGVTLAVGQSGTITYMMRVGAGVRPGNHVNTAFARNGVGDSISNQATASVQLVDDPLMDDSLIFGTVFDDRDRDGWQDSAKLSGLKAQGGFAPAAYIANSTTVDKGQGAEPAPDASAPLLHGLALGAITARQSEADPVAKHTIVIHQKLQSLDFTDDFVLTNDQGVTVRMDASGRTTTEKSGEAAAGRNAAAIEVERKVSQTADGYGVDYLIRSTGIDERGIPGVRLASVEGLLMETDPFGRYHLAGVNGGRWERGRNFILKVDPSTLPAGAQFTTSNPLLRRITPGLPVRFDFGVQLNPAFMAGEQKTAEIELGTVLFAAGSTEVRSPYLAEDGVIAQVAAKVQQYHGGELLISANGETPAVAFGRAEAVRKAVNDRLPAAAQAATQVSVRTDVNDPDSLVSGVTGHGAVLGNVLFETDKSVVRPEYQALLAKVGAYLNAQGGGVVHIVGHTDVRASHAYNQKLGMARAKAVYEALLPHLSEDLKKHLQVQAEADNASARRPVPKAASH